MGEENRPILGSILGFPVIQSTDKDYDTIPVTLSDSVVLSNGVKFTIGPDVLTYSFKCDIRRVDEVKDTAVPVAMNG